ncbi:hypothetical protein HETIRDRAFT_102025 [Heterobasidion irregulare TC 32-1]|uniref:Uncharacterized protein n=1 Tax=Heterobasidion irregulare (strain TC 32-1) TaxID=747525 RepID=W4K7C8_HETIT|nr:uncharacterized protein HETIRDRAFT_102025 [Heterobasidion irregulare TC 32-1]ETW80961.1 hypothetical protein HETIRDRAFT_102025 [Heterobasidion irregulare TC 32-1]
MTAKRSTATRTRGATHAHAQAGPRYPLALGQQLEDGELKIVRKLGWTGNSSVRSSSKPSTGQAAFFQVPLPSPSFSSNASSSKRSSLFTAIANAGSCTLAIALVFEYLTGTALFQLYESGSVSFDDVHLQRLDEFIGPFLPSSLQNFLNKRKFYDGQGATSMCPPVRSGNCALRCSAGSKASSSLLARWRHVSAITKY